jgi:hypothetical protein
VKNHSEKDQKLEIGLVIRPVEDALLPNIEESHAHEAQVDEHLPEAEEL